MIKTLKKIISLYSPTNNEELLCSYLSSLKLRNFEIINDYNNSVTFFLDNNKNKTLLVDAHIDEICSKVISITKNGFLQVHVIGTYPKMIMGKPVKILSTKLDKIIEGVNLINVPHLMRQRKKFNNPYNYNILYVDIGASSYIEASNLVNIGDSIIFDYDYKMLNKKLFVGRGLDNKIGTTILVELLKHFDKNPQSSDYNLIFNFSGREETGDLTHMHFLEHKIDYLIVLDTTIATDVPFINQEL